MQYTISTARHDFGQFLSEFIPKNTVEYAIDTVVQILHANYNKEASRLYAELLLCVCWHTEDI